MTETAAVPTKKESKTNALDLIQEHYPEKYGMIRRITHIGGPYYRVNYLDRTTGYVPTSYFVKVQDNEVILA